MKSKILSLFLAAATLAALFCAPAYAKSYDYNPVPVQCPILNAANVSGGNEFTDNSTVRNVFNLAGLFGMAYGSSIEYSNLNADYRLRLSSDPGTTAVRKSGQLTASYAVTMKNAPHTAWGHLLEKRLHFPYTRLKTENGQYIIGHSGATASNLKDNSDWENYGSTASFTSVPSTDGDDNLKLSFGTAGPCTSHGQTGVRDAVVYLADTTAPTLKKVQVTDAAGSERTFFKPGDKIKITLVFSENIRFSDNDAADHSSLALSLDVGRVDKGSTDASLTQKALISSVSGNTAAFEYTVPSEIGGITAWHFIKGIRPDSEQAFMQKSDLNYAGLQETGNYNVIKAAHVPDKAAYRKSNTLITDLAGNAVKADFSGGRVSETKVILDNRAPKIESVQVSSAMTALPQTADGELTYSDVFMGAGDRLTFTAQFDEKLSQNAAASDFKAQLNIKKGGQPIVLTGAAITETGGKTAVSFPQLTVSADMTCDSAKIDIAKITGTATDLAGNRQTDFETVVSADKSFALDTSVPEISSAAPSLFKDGFILPISVFDTGEYKSGVAGVAGAFVWKNGGSGSYTYEYQVSSAPEAENGKWQRCKTGETAAFAQTGAQQYLHIKIPDGTGEAQYIHDTELDFSVCDYAGNTGSLNLHIDNFKYDETPPSATPQTADYVFDGSYGTISVPVSFADAGGVGGIYYAWTVSGADAPQNFDEYTAFSAGADEHTAVFKKENLEPGFTHKYDLWVRAKDSCGNDSGAVKAGTYLFNLSYGKYSVSCSSEFVKNPHFDITYLEETGKSRTFLAMLEVPQSPGMYYILPVEFGGEGKTVNLFSSYYAAQQWSVGSYTKNGGKYEFAVQPLSQEQQAQLNSILEKTYYGIVNVTAIAGYSSNFVTSGGTVISTTDTANVEQSNYRVYLNGHSSETVVHGVEITYMGSKNLTKNSDYTDPDSGKMYESDLSGEQFKIDIKNLIDESFGVEDVDFENALLRMYCTKKAMDDFSAPIVPRQEIWRTSLSHAESQIVTLPALDYKSGEYYLELSVPSKWNVISDNVNTAAAKTDVMTIDASDVSDLRDNVYLNVTAQINGIDYNLHNGSAADDFMGAYGKLDGVWKIGFQEGKTTTAVLSLDSGITSQLLDTRYEKYCFIKIWNEAGGKQNAVWHKLEDADGYNSEAVNSRGASVPFTFAQTAETLDCGTELAIPLICKSGEITDNVIHYQLAYVNGKYGPVKTLKIAASDEVPQISAHWASGWSSDNRFIVNEDTLIAAASSREGELAVYKPADGQESTDFTKQRLFASAGEVFTAKQPNLSYTLHTANSFCNIANMTYFGEASREHFDALPPTVDLRAYSENEFSILTSDDVSRGDDLKLYIKFNDESYLARLKTAGCAADSDGYFELPRLSDEGYTDGAQYGGIYYSRRQDDGIYSYNFRILYDESVADGAQVPQSITVKAVDETGRETEVSGELISKNEKPRVTGLEYVTGENSGWKIYFSDYARLIEPKYAFRSGAFGEADAETPSTQFYGACGGAYNTETPLHIVYSDMLGQVHSEDVYADKSQYESYQPWGSASSELYVDFSETEPTFADVTVSIKSKGYDRETFKTEVYTMSGELISQSGAPAKNAEIVMTQNGYIKVTTLPMESGYSMHEIYIPVANIYKTAVKAQVSWYFDEWKTSYVPEWAKTAAKPVTTGRVTASISTTDVSLPISGELSYTFKPGEDQHVFLYTDALGNEGSVTAVCPVTAAAPPIPDEDVYAPEYNLTARSVLGTLAGGERSEVSGGWSQTFNTAAVKAANGGFTLQKENTPVGNGVNVSLGEMLASLPFARGFILDFDVLDATETKFFITAADKSLDGLTFENAESYVQAIEGVTVSKTSVTVRENAAPFKAVMVDRGIRHNADGINYSYEYHVTQCEILPQTLNFDTQPPQVSVSGRHAGYTNAEITASAADDKSGVTIVSPSRAVKSGDSYICTVTDNGSYSFVFRDGAYNYADKSITVDALDSSRAEVISEQWSPKNIYKNPDGSTELTNDVPQQLINPDKTPARATLVYDKAIEKFEIFADVGGTYSDAAAYADFERAQTNSVTVTFKQPCTVKVSATALNGTVTEHYLYAGDLHYDSTPPDVTLAVTGDESTSGKATAVFTAVDGPVWDSAGNRYEAGDRFEISYGKRGTYTYSFSDEAGNVTRLEAKILNIAENDPVLLIDLPDSEKATNGNVKIKIAVNEACSVQINNDAPIALFAADGTKNSDGKITEITNWHEVTVCENGSFKITATDPAGRRDTVYVSVNNIDKICPTIMFLPLTVSVRQGTSVQEALPLMDSGIYTHDETDKNVSAAFDKTLISDTMLNTAGTYEIPYTATDSAGNTATSLRFVRVYSKNKPAVRVNGIAVLEGDTVTDVGSDKTLALSVELPQYAGGTEPYTVRWRSGIKTAGQMKRNSKLVSNGSLTVPSAGIYTLMVQTQGREAAVFVIEVKQEGK